LDRLHKKWVGEQSVFPKIRKYAKKVLTFIFYCAIVTIQIDREVREV
jgi:hypothetical protein